jgi:hypothetical protein
MKRSAVVVLAASLFVSIAATGPAVAAIGAPPAPTASGAATSGAALSGSGPTATCVERIPEGKVRPTLREQFPSRGKSGHQAVLVVEVEHGPGERVLPSALDVDENSPAFRALRSAGFRFPSAKGPGRPKLERKDDANKTVTRFQLPLIPLPPTSGRTELTLPALPIAIARSSGEIVTACTTAHTISIEDPIANEPDPRPKANPAPLRQRELNTLLRNGVYAGGAGVALAALSLVLLRAWLRRPKKPVPAPPPRPPWEVALEGLEDIRRARFIEAGRFGEHFDQVSHVLRRYLGDRYGFDALESTTREILAALNDRRVRFEDTVEVRRFLDESDLVKFAKMTPTEAQCQWLWDAAQGVVLSTRGDLAPAVPPENVPPKLEAGP